MATLNVQSYLMTHSLNDLVRDHGVYARFSIKNPCKFSLNYDQLEAKESDSLAQECRGLILFTDSPVPSGDVVVGHTGILAYPMKRFFNHGQGAAANVDFLAKTTFFQEKLDGSVMFVYYDHFLKEWCVSSRSVPDADLPMDGFGAQTFGDLFWKAALETTGLKSVGEITRQLSAWHTYVFEMCTPDNQVVVRYDTYQVYLLAVRDLARPDYPEMPVKEIADALENRGVKFPLAPTYSFGNLAEMLDFVSSREPSKFEGIVVCDKDFNRVKVKNAGYLALNKIKDSVAKSPRAALEIILLEKEDDVFPLISEQTQKWILDTKEQLRYVLHLLDDEYSRVWSSDRKTFAIAIQNGSGFLGPQMSRWTGRCSSAKDWIFRNRKDGSWSDGFLESLLEMCKRAQNQEHSK